MSTFDIGNEITSARWSSRRDGNVGFLLEEHLDKAGDVVATIELGPYPCVIMDAVTVARRRIFAAAQTAQGRTSASPNPWDDLTDDQVEAMIRNSIQ